MALGYEVHEDGRQFDSGEVKRYTTAKMEFPCYVLCSSEEKKVKLHSIETLRKMLPTNQVYNSEIEHITIYYNQGSQTARIGVIQPSQVKTFLKLFEGCDIDGYLSPDEKLEGMYLYVLSD